MMRMVEAGRVIAGSARGIRLVAPGEGTRPLSDRVKESLFGTLPADGAVGRDRAFLDLFAGSGAAGIEALSRGCASAVLVEEDAAACRIIEDNLRRAHLDGGRVVRSDVATFLRRDAARNGAPFQCCLLDPPYAGDWLGPALELLADPARGWLAAGALVIAKHFWRDASASQMGNLERYRERRFGETMLSFYRNRDAAA
jgi:16S rRNA (guanine966-N2)-methyltransferase